jgi:lipoprotein-releasing system ATP-binding protein
MATGSIVLEAKLLNKYFHHPNSMHALKEISLKAYTGEILMIIGKQGSGKSTLLQCLSTMDMDFAGELFILNENITQLKQTQLAKIRNVHIGLVFQFHYLLPDFNCLKNVMLPAQKLGLYSAAEIEQKAYEKLNLLDLTDFALRSVAQLNAAQQQRVAIARALINEPKIIMCDEPAGNLDCKNTQIIFDIFKQLAKENNQTIICVTHDLDFAENSDRIIEIQDGIIVNAL